MSSVKRTAALMSAAIIAKKAVGPEVIRPMMFHAPVNVWVFGRIGVVAFGEVIVIKAPAEIIISGVYVDADAGTIPPWACIPPTAMLIDVWPVPVERWVGLSGKIATG